MRPTFHLVAASTWSAAAGEMASGHPYAADSLAIEGFIHCTDGVDALGQTFDRFYAADPRAFVALTVDLDALDVAWRYDEPASPWPHIYGTIVPSAVVAVTAVRRARDGRFDGLADPA